AERINKSNNGKVAYRKADITSTGFEDKSFDIIFSHGVLEHFSDQGISAALSEGFRISDTYIISVPTIWDKSGCLTGDERLMTVRSWQRIIKKSGLQIAETQSFYPKNIKPGNWWQKIWPAGNAVFVLTR
ncbi:MAG: class I SAM-dependent methyltransferase, partial [Alphaproteobacteria bacterium]|nr:class I SAM-dependent methyltransferase [Alphaproteobacteria bacterium]